HSHTAQEEFFLILSGTGMLRMNNEELPVRSGDFVAKPAGQGLAHQFINTGTDILKILDCGLVVEADTVTYPDEGVVLVKPENMAFKSGQVLERWDSNPNQHPR
ncbi:MAG: cupin domain-containing protein, partial [Deltaproteobacteria bacterium]|nr:cupin domain-containing protein [Deltaproteobacteria bacterium]